MVVIGMIIGLLDQSFRNLLHFPPKEHNVIGGKMTQMLMESAKLSLVGGVGEERGNMNIVCKKQHTLIYREGLPHFSHT